MIKEKVDTMKYSTKNMDAYCNDLTVTINLFDGDWADNIVSRLKYEHVEELIEMLQHVKECYVNKDKE